MISKKELQIGDLIYNHRKWICPVVDFREEGITVIACHYGEETFREKDLYPIELDAEFLLRQGFVNKTDWWEQEGDPHVYLLETDDWYISVEFRDDFDNGQEGNLHHSWTKHCELFVENYRANRDFHAIYHIINVHELQHAMRICNIDKEFEIKPFAE